MVKAYSLYVLGTNQDGDEYVVTVCTYKTREEAVADMNKEFSEGGAWYDQEVYPEIREEYFAEG